MNAPDDFDDEAFIELCWDALPIILLCGLLILL